MAERAAETYTGGSSPMILGGCLAQFLKASSAAVEAATPPESDKAVALRVLKGLARTTIIDGVRERIEEQRIMAGEFPGAPHVRAANFTLDTLEAILEEQVSQGETHGTGN